jgi:formate/nitrite transporter
MEKSVLSPKEIAESAVNISVNKANYVWWKQILLAVLAGLFIGLAGNGASICAYSASSAGMAKMLSGVLFGAGLIMVLLAGAELFTGNSLMVIGLLEKKITLAAMLKNWVLVYIGNFIGGVGLAFLINQTTQLNMDKGELGAYAINTALSKCNMDFKSAFIMGIFCNVLVCIAVWISWASKEGVSKVIGLYLPIWLFVTSGYEHCVANMYFIPVGLFAKSNEVCLAMAEEKYGITAAQLGNLDWSHFLINNLVPVTLGNIVGGAVIVGMVYWLVYLKKTKV